MLRANRKSPLPSAAGARFAIVAARYNTRYVDGMIRAAKAELKAACAGVIEVVRVPGSFEIPLAAAALARRKANRPVAVLCFGVLWQGETTHADHIGQAVTEALMRISVETGVPAIHEVLTVSKPEQAKVRCLDPETNRGSEAAHTALEMAKLLADLADPDEIPF